MVDQWPLSVWTLYDNTTSDFPGEYVLREFHVDRAGSRPGDTVLTCIHVEPLIEQAELMGLTRLERNDEDDAVILCSFIQ